MKNGVLLREMELEDQQGKKDQGGFIPFCRHG